MNKELLEKILDRKEFKDLTEASYLENRKILITGGNGSIGSELYRRLLKDKTDYELLCKLTVTDIDNLDITDEHAVESFINIYNPEIIVNIAGAKQGLYGKKSRIFWITLWAGKPSKTF